MTKDQLITRIDEVIALPNSRTGVPGLIEAAQALQAAEPEADYSRAIRMLVNLQLSIEKRPDVPVAGSSIEDQETMMPDWIVDEALKAARLAVVGA